MDKNTIIGAILIALIMIGGTYLLSPTKAEEEANKKSAEKSKVVELKKDTAQKVISDTLSKASSDSLPGIFKALQTINGQNIVIKNDKIELTISTKGANVVGAKLLGYKTYKGTPIILSPRELSEFTYKFGYQGDEIKTKDLNFVPSNVTEIASKNSSASATFTCKIGDGQAIIISYQLPDAVFMAEHSLTLQGMDKVIDKRLNFIDIDWKNTVAHNEKDVKISRDNTTIHYRPLDEDPDYLSESKTVEETIKTKVEWISFKQQFFCQTLISENEKFLRAELKSERLEDNDTTHIKNLSAALTLPYEHEAIKTYKFKTYYGPLQYNILNKFDLGMERQIPLGWGFFLISWVNRFIIIPIFNFLGQFISNYGIVILILTIVIKLITLPFTYKSYLSTAKMKVLKPELDALKAKYGGDMAKMQSEQMTIYRQAGVSPLGGCLPMLLQLPILLAMFRFFPSSIELRQKAFLWAKDLSTYDSILDFGPVPDFVNSIYGDHVSLFTLLMTISTILQAHFNAKNMTGEQAQLKWMGYVMPIFFLGLFNKYAAGLSLYYFLFNMVTFVQQYIFKKLVDEDKLRKIIEENRKKPKAKKKSKFQERLEQIQKQSQDMQKAKQQQLNSGKKK